MHTHGGSCYLSAENFSVSHGNYRENLYSTTISCDGIEYNRNDNHVCILYMCLRSLQNVMCIECLECAVLMEFNERNGFNLYVRCVTVNV